MVEVGCQIQDPRSKIQDTRPPARPICPQITQITQIPPIRPRRNHEDTKTRRPPAHPRKRRATDPSTRAKAQRRREGDSDRERRSRFLAAERQAIGSPVAGEKVDSSEPERSSQPPSHRPTCPWHVGSASLRLRAFALEGIVRIHEVIEEDAPRSERQESSASICVICGPNGWVGGLGDSFVSKCLRGCDVGGWALCPLCLCGFCLPSEE
jgi:hypothetical protein